MSAKIPAFSDIGKSTTGTRLADVPAGVRQHWQDLL